MLTVQGVRKQANAALWTKAAMDMNFAGESGTSGAHTYSVSYKMSRLVKSYSDADGFNHMFVARGISPSPKQARLTIAMADTLFTQEDVHMWAFGFIGEIALKDGKIVAESSEPFRENSSMIALVQIKKGLLHPVAEAKGSFEKVKERAFEDSDYLNGNSDLSGEDIICIILMFGIPLGIILISKLCIYSRRRTLLGKSIDRADYRDLPENCSLLKANAILNYLSYLPRSNKYLFQAYMTDFFVRGILEVRTEKRRGGFTETCLKIHDWNDNGVEKEDGKIESLLYKMICKAADDEKILHANDLKKIKDKKLAVKLYGALTKKVEVSKNDHKEAKQLFGLKRYLERSTQINELSLSEMSLWKRHLVYAALLGCNKRAFKELERICPDITQLSQPDFRGKQKEKFLLPHSIQQSNCFTSILLCSTKAPARYTNKAEVPTDQAEVEVTEEVLLSEEVADSPVEVMEAVEDKPFPFYHPSRLN